MVDLLTSKAGEGLTLAEASAHLKVSKSTAHRYLTTLEELKVAERDAKDGFRLGPKLIEVAGVFLSKHDLARASQPTLERLASETEETAHLAAPLGTSVVYLAKVEGPHSVRMVSQIGTRNPMHCTALGKAILAYSPPDKLQHVLHEGLSQRTPNSITSAEALFAELERVRASGFAVDDQENEMGVRCAGAPVFDLTGRVVGALSVSGPASRLTADRCRALGPAVAQAALEVSRGMGYHSQAESGSAGTGPAHAPGA